MTNIRFSLFTIFLLLAGCVHKPPGQAYPSRIFLLQSQAAPPKAQSLSKEAEEFLLTLESYLQLQPPPGALLRIYHYRWRWSLWYYLLQTAPSFCWRPAVCFETNEAYHIAISGRPESKRFHKNLHHELTHYLLTAHYSYLPPWLDEGLAQIMSFGPPFPHLPPEILSVIKGVLETQYHDSCIKVALYPPTEMMNVSEYYLACALTYYLLKSEKEGINRFHRYLKHIHPQGELPHIFSEELGISIDEACKNLGPFYQTFNYESH